jgi:hypothetical protein
MTNVNPWITGPERAADPEPETPTPTRRAVRTGPAAPQAGVSVPDTADRLPRRSQMLPAKVWWLGVHGGAGESTLAALAQDTRAAQHGWPIADPPTTATNVVLVARSNYQGLTAAQRAATEWASGALGGAVNLGGLVLIADAPGRLPKPLRDLQQVVGGGLPRVWTLPWVDAWRLGPAAPSTPLPKPFRELFAELRLNSSSPAHD